MGASRSYLTPLPGDVGQRRDPLGELINDPCDRAPLSVVASDPTRVAAAEKGLSSIGSASPWLVEALVHELRVPSRVRKEGAPRPTAMAVVNATHQSTPRSEGGRLPWR
jgi:hypothetical protein